MERVDAPPATRTRAKPSPAKTAGTASPSAASGRSRPGRGRAEGQGRVIPCSPPAPASRCSTRSCATIRPPPARCAPASRFRAPRPPPRSCALNADEAALRDLRFAVGDPLGPAANLLSLWRDLAGRPPSLDPGRISDAAARLDLALLDPISFSVEPEGLRRGGRSGLGGRESRRRWPSPPSRTPQRPNPKSWRSGHSTWSSPSGCAGRGPCR